MTQPKKLIEVAMPIKEISAESVRDKSIRHGHISTLHLWWARRPLPVCRAVVFASLVPDPEDENCPQAFRDAIELLLGSKEKPLIEQGLPHDPYQTYKDIPWTAVYDPMEDTLRNRLQMFIGKFSEPMQEHLMGKAIKPGAKDMLSGASLIKWDNKNDDTIIGKARKLIWVAHNTSSGKIAKALLADFDTAYKAIKTAENELYSIADRHIATEEVQTKETALQQTIDAFQDKMPKVFDPFAGGGAIPLEAARLGCKTYGNDINPVAHIIQKGSLEFPQKYGKPITYSNAEFTILYGEKAFQKIPNEWKTFSAGNVTGVRIPNRLSFDVEYFAKKLLAESEKEIGHLYPSRTVVDTKTQKKKQVKPIAYYWARVGSCSNPSCNAKIPLLKQFYLANTNSKKVFLKPKVKDNTIEFSIEEGVTNEEGWVSRGNLTCPCCGNATDVKTLKKQFLSNKTSERLLAVIWESDHGKEYRLPSEEDIKSIDNLPMDGIERPAERMPVEYTQALPSCTWGLETWGGMFAPRQLLAIQTLVKNLNFQKTKLLEFGDYGKSIVTYLGMLIDRGTAISTSFGRWDVSRENIQSPFSKQAIPMMLDYPEGNLFGDTTGSLTNQLSWITRYIESECESNFSVVSQNASSGDKAQFGDKSITAVVTDPPYYDAIAYADLSDFFYVWLKRTIGDIYPLNFATPQTPKSEECTALKHHRDNSKTKAKQHFEDKLTQIFDAIEHQTSDIVSIMFAHQSTEAWTTLCNSVLGARMNITGSWPIDTEMANRSLGLAGAVLASSVTVSARPSQRQGYGTYKDVKKAIEIKVATEVEELYRLGFRGADLLTACFGQAVSEFGKYEKVEKADGSEVIVAELLEMARDSALNAHLKGFNGDDFTKFYIHWMQLYGFAESDFDDAAQFSRMALTINVQELFNDHILVKDGKKQALGSFKERLAASKNLGEKANSHLIDQVHRAMFLYQGTNRGTLLEYIHRVASNTDSSFWRVLTSLCEILPAGCDDHKQATGLITNKESLIRESATAQRDKASQSSLFE
jgi:putative DNA methylase